MSMRALAAAVASVRPPCADVLWLVDRAFARTRGPEAHELAETICPGCPAVLADACFMQGMTGTANTSGLGGRSQELPSAGEHGVWGGTLETERRRIRRRR